MSLNIKNAETERLVRELAATTGQSVTGAVTTAVKAQLDRLLESDSTAASERAARITAIGQDAASRWVEPQRSTDHGDLLYDAQGLPR